MLLTVDNHKEAWVTIPDAVATGHAFAVPVQSDVLAVDCDDPNGAPRLWEIAGQLEDMDYLPVVVQSGTCPPIPGNC